MNTKKIITISTNILVLIASFFLILYTLQYEILYDHDLTYPYFRNFFEPEHGRFIPFYLSSIFIDKLPLIFNIHPNDFLKDFIIPIQAFFIIFFAGIIANTINLFNEKQNVFSVFSLDVPWFFIVYIVVFLSLFNEQLFLSYEFRQNLIFWEYPMGLIPFILLILFCTHHYVNKVVLNKKSFIFILILLFFIGISIEPTNLVILIGLITVTISKIIKNKFLTKKNLKIYIANFVYYISLFIYYTRGNDSEFNYGEYSFIEYLRNEICNFVLIHLKDFICIHSKLLLPIIIILISIYFMNRNEKSKKFLTITGLGLFLIISFHIATFLWGYNDYEAVKQGIYYDQSFYINYHKFIKIYQIMLIFYFVLVLSFLINISLDINKETRIFLNFSIPILIFLLGQKYFIFDMPERIHYFLKKTQTRKILAYISEKEIIKSNTEVIILPMELKEKDIQSYNNSNLLLLNKKIIHFPLLNNKKEIIFSSEKLIDYSIISEKEKDTLRFSELLIKKRVPANKNEID